ncbi:hypothetical protein LuPra_01672 [Luteitalea pratensis]|uniref:Uncharacterized protein n=1 Tax=Luteitalea pratensis TaxID=1855912 RepID=A0A143PIR7_LUTPR|nr:hypothetical protein LuPra_01672 [Luteitalea pratensis]
MHRDQDTWIEQGLQRVRVAVPARAFSSRADVRWKRRAEILERLREPFDIRRQRLRLHSDLWKRRPAPVRRAVLRIRHVRERAQGERQQGRPDSARAM